MKVACSIDGCAKAAYVKGLCTTHYKRFWRHGENFTQIVHDYKGAECSTENCKRKARSRGFCKLHFQQLYRVGANPALPEKPNFKRKPYEVKGYVKIHRGRAYRIIYCKKTKKFRFEHRVIAEKALGKPLPKGAIVHHANGNSLDNRPENLVICPNQAYHLLLHKRMRALARGDKTIKRDQ